MSNIQVVGNYGRTIDRGGHSANDDKIDFVFDKPAELLLKVFHRGRFKLATLNRQTVQQSQAYYNMSLSLFKVFTQSF